MLDGAALRQDTLRPPLATALGLLGAVEAATFLIFASLHLGLRIPLGSPRWLSRTSGRLPASRHSAVLPWGPLPVIIFAGWRHAWLTAVVAHVVSICGVLLGMAALAAGRGPRTESNDVYHLTIPARDAGRPGAARRTISTGRSSACALSPGA